MPPTALIGRDAQLQALLDDFATARSGAGRSVLVRGPAGSGAGGLVARFREELGARQLGHRWLGTRGRLGDTAYAALAALLPAGGDGLEGLLADLGSVPVEARPAVVGDRLARALRSGGAPLVVAIDRADHLDRRASAALTTAARALADSACLVVATVGEDGDWPADRVLSLGPLDPPDARLLAEQPGSRRPPACAAARGAVQRTARPHGEPVAVAGSPTTCGRPTVGRPPPGCRAGGGCRPRRGLSPRPCADRRRPGTSRSGEDPHRPGGARSCTGPAAPRGPTALGRGRRPGAGPG